MDEIILTNFSKNVRENLGKTEWVTVFEFLYNNGEVDRGAYFCALISNNKVEEVLSKYDWDLHIGNGKPGFCTTYTDGKEKNEYYRFSEEGIEPLVYWRTFSGKDQTYLEICEEFRLYFDLFEEIKGYDNKLFIYINDDGDDDEVIKITKNKVQIKLKYIKEFLAVKQMHLAIYFEAMRFLPETIEKLKIASVDKITKGDNYIYSLCVRDLPRSDTSSQGWLLGKKLITGLRDFKPNIFGQAENEKHEEFIIGVDEDGKEIFAKCLTDYQGKPHYLTPVFFKREVLKKYYDDPSKYTVEDAHVKRNGFWSLRIMNNHQDHVVVWLGDLKHIPYKEQTHWKAFNVSPSDRKISYTDFARNINGEFTDPEHPELYFKYKFAQLQKAWQKKIGWYLFLPLSQEDDHHLASLHVPTNNGQKEFDEQVASITKILIDSLNQEELEKGLVIDKDHPGSIDKLEAFLDSKHLSIPEMVKFLRSLQNLRSTGVAHRKGSGYEKIKKYFSIGEKPLPAVFEDILIKCIFTLNTLEKRFNLVG